MLIAGCFSATVRVNFSSCRKESSLNIWGHIETPKWRRKESMKVTSAKYGVDYAGYPFLELVIDGRLTRISRDSLKTTIVDAGFVSLGPDWRDRIDGRKIFGEITIPLKDEEAPAIVRGSYTNDSVVLRFARQFIKESDGKSFRPGKELR